ncbi:MAG: CoA transferase [Thermoflexaceae bacterium]|nr:CoA transferase [Thermoflexaceae bacterium]
MPGAFEPFRILDFSTRLPGAMATMLFADLGADVVRVESAAQRACRTHPGFLCWDRNKRRVALDVATFAGLDAARRLLATADVAVFDDAPGELERLGLDGVTVCAANPRILHTWLPAYAAEGRWAQLPPDELLLTAVSGVARMQASYGNTPVALVTPQVAYAHATIAANAIAAGLWEREHSGRGQALLVSGLHAVSSIESGGAITYDGQISRLGRGSRGAVPHYRLYQCADGEWFFLGSLTAPFFLKALEAIGLTDLLADPAIEGDFARLFVSPGSETAIARLDAHFLTQPRAHWLRVLHEAGVPRGPVGRREEWFREETVAANGMHLTLEHPVHGTVELPGVPLLMSDTPGAVRGFVEDANLAAVLAERPLPAAAEDVPGAAPVGRPPLAGVRVLDLGAFIAGTFAPTVLANLGADVTKIEPTGGDPFRPYGLGFLGHNLGKRSLAMDIKHPAARGIFEEMVRQADVVLDNFRLGVRERLGIDYATLAAINPRIITCSVTGYGPKGELAADPGFDPLMQARSGMMRAQGGEEEPVFHQIAVNDTATAMMAAFGMLAALHSREQTGRGQEVQTCLASQSVLFQSGELTWYEGREPSPTGGRDFIGPNALRRFYPVRDGWVAVACGTPAEFQQLALALGHPEWAGRMTAEQALTAPAQGDLAELIAAAFAELSLAEAMDRLVTRAVPAAPALGIGDIFTDPWLEQNRVFRTVPDRTFGEVTCVRSYADWSRSEGGFAYAAPAIGEHSLEILGEFGVDGETVAKLIAEGAMVAN